MNRLSFCGSRLAALCAALVFLLGAMNGAAQRLNPGSDVFCGWRDGQTKAEASFRTPCFASGNSVNVVPGLRAAHIQPASLNSTSDADNQNARPQPSLGNKDRGAPNSIGQFAKNIVRDQAGMWTSPLRIRRHDLV
ncbi:MAG TPA: hypothetical protein VGQ11_04680, partial [Candidatus Acidoferrales bacterium]|nr:hypothetical protein [Candidatus Acidoferrales bacterium]